MGRAYIPYTMAWRGCIIFLKEKEEEGWSGGLLLSVHATMSAVPFLSYM